MKIFNKYLAKDSLFKTAYIYSFGLTIMGVLSPNLSLLIINIIERFGWLLLVFFIIFFVVYFIQTWRYKKTVTINVNGNKVTLRKGDIFEEQDWKIIPFNSDFDTTVNDVIISKNSLNGIFITKHVSDLNNLKLTIKEAKNQIQNENGKCELGTIIKYDDYLLLALSNFDKDNKANLSIKEFNSCLYHMWDSLDTVYANRPISLPLIGSGITRIESRPNYYKILLFILWSLYFTNIKFKRPINIILTDEVLKEIKLFNFKFLFQ